MSFVPSMTQLWTILFFFFVWKDGKHLNGPKKSLPRSPDSPPRFPSFTFQSISQLCFWFGFPCDLALAYNVLISYFSRSAFSFLYWPLINLSQFTHFGCCFPNGPEKGSTGPRDLSCSFFFFSQQFDTRVIVVRAENDSRHFTSAFSSIYLHCHSGVLVVVWPTYIILEFRQNELRSHVLYRLQPPFRGIYRLYTRRYIEVVEFGRAALNWIRTSRWETSAQTFFFLGFWFCHLSFLLSHLLNIFRLFLLFFFVCLCVCYFNLQRMTWLHWSFASLQPFCFLQGSQRTNGVDNKTQCCWWGYIL